LICSGEKPSRHGTEQTELGPASAGTFQTVCFQIITSSRKKERGGEGEEGREEEITSSYCVWRIFDQSTR
jgi:hypothetical protein